MLCLTSFHLQQFKARVLCNCMDHTWLAAVTMHTTNLILVPKISWWFVFILICGRRERSKKKIILAFTHSNMWNWNNITSFTKNNYQPKFSRHSFYFFIRYKTKKKHDWIKTCNLQVDKKIKYSGKNLFWPLYVCDNSRK